MLPISGALVCSMHTPRQGTWATQDWSEGKWANANGDQWSGRQWRAYVDWGPNVDPEDDGALLAEELFGEACEGGDKGQWGEPASGTTAEWERQPVGDAGDQENEWGDSQWDNEEWDDNSQEWDDNGQEWGDNGQQWWRAAYSLSTMALRLRALPRL